MIFAGEPTSLARDSIIAVTGQSVAIHCNPDLVYISNDDIDTDNFNPVGGGARGKGSLILSNMFREARFL